MHGAILALAISVPNNRFSFLLAADEFTDAR